jgi:hypothetical protein
VPDDEDTRSKGSTATYNVPVVAPATGGQITNTVTVSGTRTDPNSTNNTASVTTTVNDTIPPALAITSHSNGQHVSTSNITLSGTASDSGNGNDGIQQVTINGIRADNDMATGSGTANWSKAVTLNPGANSITVVAYDNSSNHNMTTVILTIYCDVAQAPTVTTGPANKVTQHSAILTGIVNPNGLLTTYYFQWGLTTAYGNVTSSQSAGSGWDNVVVSANLSGLTQNANYHYRLVATNSAGTTYGADMSFIANVKSMPWLLLLLGD